MGDYTPPTVHTIDPNAMLISHVDFSQLETYKLRALQNTIFNELGRLMLANGTNEYDQLPTKVQRIYEDRENALRKINTILEDR